MDHRQSEPPVPRGRGPWGGCVPLRPLRDCGFTEADFKSFPLSVEANQQRLMTNAYYPFDLESEEAIYRKCY